MMPPPDQLTERQRRIVDLVEDQGYATVEALAEHLAVSMQTARRDIIRLAAVGHLQRFHGGAGLPESRARLGTFSKSAVVRDPKERIAAAAASRIGDGASVFLDVGTTAEAVAQVLAKRKDLRIITNSLNCAQKFQDAPSNAVLVLGGALRGADGSLVGELTTSTVQGFTVDVAIIGCSAIEGDGAVMDYDVDKIAVKRLVLARARQSFLVADATKFKRHAVARIAALADFSALVTDEIPPIGVVAWMGDCQLIVAEDR